MLIHSFARLWLPVLLWMGTIFFLSSRPGTDYPEVGFAFQKGAHVLVFGVLAVLLFRALEGSGLATRPAYFWAWLGASLYGVTDEIHQLFVPARFGNPVDVAIDSVGAALGLFTLFVARRVWMGRE